MSKAQPLASFTCGKQSKKQKLTLALHFERRENNKKKVCLYSMTKPATATTPAIMAPVVTWLLPAAALVEAGDEAGEVLLSEVDSDGVLPLVGTATLGGLLKATDELGLTRALDETATDELCVGRKEGVCECECDGVGVGVGVLL